MSNIIKKLRLLSSPTTFYIQVRNSRMNPLVPIQRKFIVPELFFSLEERLNETNERVQDPEKYSKVNIGFSGALRKPRKQEKFRTIQDLRNNTELEKLAHQGTLKVDLEVIQKEWENSLKPYHVKELAENYEIYKHLFGDYAFFYPVVTMNILYDFNEELMSPVYYGNLLKPKEVKSEPNVQFQSDSESLWSLIFTSPDDNLLEKDSEMIHWFIGNIPGNDVKKGEEIVDYMQPIPPKGTGFHRYCFVLYKQNKKIDFSRYRKSKPLRMGILMVLSACKKIWVNLWRKHLSLQERTFNTFDFYKEFEDDLTPAGLSWFQADYDVTLINFFHKTLHILDLHRDPKEMQKLILLKRLKNVHPFQGEKPLYPFPQALPVDKKWPIWLKNEIRDERDGKGRYRDMYREDDRPYIHEGKAVINVLPFKSLK
ncbi:39S ribosomal protein L38, mitochondrial [Armadillidium nasatum]|uniref:Large ribosomal subunit protein mL38 n=1 Tax=Armadillidium nasatum TaxID=96803 RepID=A0A5N5SL93_9CRUS|nr:39S ribosomal protein L38, mitochondrial [Armadillidium nasatum]